MFRRHRHQWASIELISSKKVMFVFFLWFTQYRLWEYDNIQLSPSTSTLVTEATCLRSRFSPTTRIYAGMPQVETACAGAYK